MAINCKHIPEENLILVNGKPVRKDMDGVWRAAYAELTAEEAKAFQAFHDTLERHPRLGIKSAHYKLNH